MEIATFAPVLIPTLNRYEHFRRCVESLSRCTYADQTELVIGLDFPPSEKYVEGWKKICEYVNTISGFGKVTIFRREENFGVDKNIDDISEYAAKKYDCYIFSEDDNEFSPNFLDYINQGLDIYKDNPQVFAICGYNYPIDLSDYNKAYYFSHEFAAWGYGGWFEKAKRVSDIIKSPKYVIDLYKSYPLSVYFKNNLKLMVLSTRIGDGFLGDIYLTSFLHSHNVFTVFPSVSLVRNWGHDGSGINCSLMEKSLEEIYTKQRIADESTFSFDNDLPIEINKNINKKIVSFKHKSFAEKIKQFICFVLIRMYAKFK